MCVLVPCVGTAGVSVTLATRKPHASSCLPFQNSRGHFGSSQPSSASSCDGEGAAVYGFGNIKHIHT